jgi:hypothetical protein
VVTSGFSEHVGDQLGGDRGSGLVFLILTSVREVGKDGGDSTGRGNLILVVIYGKCVRLTLQAWIMMHNSINEVFTDPAA